MDENQSLKIILDRIDSEIQYLDNLLSQFNCVICMDYLKDPLTLNCGHTFCTSCLTKYFRKSRILPLLAISFIFEKMGLSLLTRRFLRFLMELI